MGEERNLLSPGNPLLFHHCGFTDYMTVQETLRKTPQKILIVLFPTNQSSQDTVLFCVSRLLALMALLLRIAFVTGLLVPQSLSARLPHLCCHHYLRLI